MLVEIVYEVLLVKHIVGGHYLFASERHEDVLAQAPLVLHSGLYAINPMPERIIRANLCHADEVKLAEPSDSLVVI